MDRRYIQNYPQYNGSQSSNSQQESYNEDTRRTFPADFQPHGQQPSEMSSIPTQGASQAFQKNLSLSHSTSERIDFSFGFGQQQAQPMNQQYMQSQPYHPQQPQQRQTPEANYLPMGAMPDDPAIIAQQIEQLQAHLRLQQQKQALAKAQAQGHQPQPQPPVQVQAQPPLQQPLMNTQNDKAYQFTVTVIPCGNENQSLNKQEDWPYELNLVRQVGEQHNLKDVCLRNEAVWRKVFKHLLKPNVTANEVFPNFAVYRTPFDVNVAIAGMANKNDNTSTDLTNGSGQFPSLLSNHSPGSQIASSYDSEQVDFVPQGEDMQVTQAELILHILYMKTNEKKLNRNFNAQELELFCHNRFYGPLIVAHNLNKAPFPLVSFSTADLKNIESINRNIQNKSIKDDFVPQCLMDHRLLNQNLTQLLEQEDRYAFFMFNYKTSWCPNKKDNHDSKSCVFAHHMRDFRRPPMLFKYNAEDCEITLQQNISWDQCPRGLKCQKCHTMVERLYHPEKYKRIQCDKQRCNKLEICAFYHGIKERNLAIKLSKQFRKNTATNKKLQTINDLHQQLTRFYANEKQKQLSSMDSVQNNEEEAEERARNATAYTPTTNQQKQTQEFSISGALPQHVPQIDYYQAGMEPQAPLAMFQKSPEAYDPLGAQPSQAANVKPFQPSPQKPMLARSTDVPLTNQQQNEKNPYISLQAPSYDPYHGHQPQRALVEQKSAERRNSTSSVSSGGYISSGSNNSGKVKFKFGRQAQPGYVDSNKKKTNDQVTQDPTKPLNKVFGQDGLLANNGGGLQFREGKPPHKKKRGRVDSSGSGEQNAWLGPAKVQDEAYNPGTGNGYTAFRSIAANQTKGPSLGNYLSSNSEEQEHQPSLLNPESQPPTVFKSSPTDSAEGWGQKRAESGEQLREQAFNSIFKVNEEEFVGSPTSPYPITANQKKAAFQIPVQNAPTQVCNFDFLEDEEDFFMNGMNTKSRHNSDYVRRQSNVSAADVDQEQKETSPTPSPQVNQGKIGNFQTRTSFDEDFDLIISEFKGKNSGGSFHRARRMVTAEEGEDKEIDKKE